LVEIFPVAAQISKAKTEMVSGCIQRTNFGNFFYENRNSATLKWKMCWISKKNKRSK